ncbi:hypothetical protein FRC09_017558 [Ceratobasidium sp. 395]|nr:hypothetical protein FRC09_017558 [Ceratobasidium sp. 395]
MRLWVSFLLTLPSSISLALVDVPGRPRHVNHARLAKARPARTHSGSGLNTIGNARVRRQLPNFELIYGSPAEYALGRALEDSILVRGRPLGTWPYEVQPDLSNFKWMSYERARRVLSGTPPTLQPSPIMADGLSYMDIYVSIQGNEDYTVRITLGIIIRVGNASAPMEPAPTPTLSPGSPVLPPAPPPGSFLGLHGPILAVLVAACALFLILILGGLGWLIAMRRHMKKQGALTRHTVSPEPRGRSPTARWPRTTAHSLSFVPPNPTGSTLTNSTRRRVRTADHGIPSAPTPEPEPVSPEKPVESRKRAATLIQTIHTRAIRGSPKIESSKRTLSPDLSSSRKRPNPGQSSPRIGTRIKREELPMVEQTRRDEFTNSWCSALHLDPFQSPGASVDTDNGQDRQTSPGAGIAPSATMESRRIRAERPKSPTPTKAVWGKGHRTMSLSELGGSLAGRMIGMSNVPRGEVISADSSMLSVGPSGSNPGDTPTPRASQIRDTTTKSNDSLSKRLDYAERTNQIGMALFSLPSEPTSPEKSIAAAAPLGLSFDSFFSPKSMAEESQFEETTAEPRYGDVSSERMVRIAQSQETVATTYVTAPESGASPNTFRDGSILSAGHGPVEPIGIIGSPSTSHSQIAELDDISSPLLAGQDEERTQVAEISSQSLTVEYGRADQSLRVLDSFPGMLRGSLSYFPEDVEITTPVLPSTSRAELSFREPNDILLLPEEDLAQGCIRLARVESVERMGASSRSHAVEATEEVNTSAQGDPSKGTTEDSIISPNISEQNPTQDDSILSRTKASESVDSLQVK